MIPWSLQRHSMPSAPWFTRRICKMAKQLIRLPSATPFCRCRHETHWFAWGPSRRCHWRRSGGRWMGDRFCPGRPGGSRLRCGPRCHRPGSRSDRRATERVKVLRPYRRSGCNRGAPQARVSTGWGRRRCGLCARVGAGTGGSEAPPHARSGTGWTSGSGHREFEFRHSCIRFHSRPGHCLASPDCASC